MATFQAAQAKDTFPLVGHNSNGVVVCARGFYSTDTAVSAGDIIEMCKVPEGYTIIDGFLRCNDLDTNGTPTIDLNVGISSDTDLLLDGGVLNGSAVTNYLPEGGIRVPFMGLLNSTGGYAVTAETKIQIGVVAAAATAASTQTFEVCVFYTRTQSLGS